MASLRKDPAFIDIVRERGLEDYWRTTGHWGQFCQPDGESPLRCH